MPRPTDASDKPDVDAAGFPLSSSPQPDAAALLPLLGICPLLVASTRTMDAVVFGTCVLASLVAANAGIAALRRLVQQEIRIAVYLTMLAALATCTGFLLQATLHAPSSRWLPLIAICGALCGFRNVSDVSDSPLAAARAGLVTGTTVLTTLVIVGAAREILGRSGLHLALLPPAAFLLLAACLALQQRWRRR